MLTMKVKIISTAFSSLSLLKCKGEIYGLSRKWIFIPNPPSNFKIRLVKNYSFQLSNYLTPTNVKYHRELEGVEDCSFFKSYLIGGRRGKNYINEAYLFSYPKITELGKLNVHYDNSPTYGDKNLSPFAIGKKQFILYSINPLVVLQLDSLEATPVQVNSRIPYIPEVHGGTALIPYNKEELLGVCHSYTSIDKARNYTIYAYTLKKSSPFKILRFSTPLVTNKNIPKNLKCPNDCWWMDPRKSKVVFERGLVKNKRRVLIGFGIQDCAAAIAVLSKNELEKNLKPISE